MTPLPPVMVGITGRTGRNVPVVTLMPVAPPADEGGVTQMTGNPIGYTDRQRREAAFYEQYAPRQRVRQVDLEPVQASRRRPWNSYWRVFDHAIERRRDGRLHRALDFGCGVGIAAVRLAMLGCEVHGFDICDANVKAADELARRHGVGDRCHFATMTAEQLQYEDRSFDLIVGIDILHHVEIAVAAREAARVLKPGGLAVFREHLEVPALDWIRRSRLIEKLAPSATSLDHHITEDERKLDRNDLRVIADAFDAVEIERFGLLSRCERIAPAWQWVRSGLQRADRTLTRIMPPLERLGGAAVITATRHA